eukprot:TRINITY_DN49169_c0_g1_i1.p1 TRINITY_DN49169_c0_g1~~TRINITY_DN49169_c0_g1_i1.p1  ORF type:complete len:558 (+),score=111.31 TRINITY_DN49169_c0_g1_i1:25-1674(+)
MIATVWPTLPQAPVVVPCAVLQAPRTLQRSQGPATASAALAVVALGGSLAAARRQSRRCRGGRAERAYRCVMTAAAGKGTAIVVGAGPAGLAAALMLAKRGWSATVLERSADPACYDPGRGFMYLIDGRGQKCLKDLDAELLAKLQAASVTMAETTIGVLTPKGLSERVNPMKDATRSSYWIPRNVFVQLLFDEAKRHDRIHFVLDAQLEDISYDEASQHFSAKGSATSQDFQVHGELLLGADGIRSPVREHMEQWDGSRGRFEPKRLDSPAAGLRYKVLKLPNSFEIATADGDQSFKSEVWYAVRGAASSGPKHKLGLIPVRSDHGYRTANLITYPEDAVWEADSAEAFMAYAEKQWPHFPVSKLVPPEELERFAADAGGRFPRPQHSPSAVLSKAEGSAAVIIGDALHAFPPDIGQGVNSALEDVSVLSEALATCESETLSVSLQRFETERMPDVEALVRMVAVAAPFQYSQAPWRGRLWTASFLTRFLLNKALPKVFDLPVFLLVQQSELSYREVWQRGGRGARRARALLGSTAALLGCLVAKLLS